MGSNKLTSKKSSEYETAFLKVIWNKSFVNFNE